MANIDFIKEKYSYTVKNGLVTFSRKDNDRCKIVSRVEAEADEYGEYEKLRINLFQCFQPVGTASAGVPRSGGVGREMMLYFLMYMKVKNPNIRIVYLNPIAHPDKQNMSSSQQNEYTTDISRHQQKLEEYYNSLGFTLYTYVVQDEGETDYYRFFEGNIDYIIETIDNFEKMRQFNFNSYVDPRIERQMMEQFGIETTTREHVNTQTGSSKNKKKSNKSGTHKGGNLIGKPLIGRRKNKTNKHRKR